MAIAPVLAGVTGMDEYQRRVLDAAAALLAERRVPLLVHVDGPSVRGRRSTLLRGLLENRPVLGILRMNTLSVEEQEDADAALAGRALPTVYIGREVEGALCVRGDNATGMRELMRHVLSIRQPRQVVLVRGLAHQRDSIEREAVFREEMAHHGLAVDEGLVLDGAFAAERTTREMSALLRERRDIDLVVALNDRSAVAALDTLIAAGLRVPEDVAVTGFDDEVAASHWPGLTTVDQQLEEQGRLAARLLLRQHDGAIDPQVVVVPSRVVIRGSAAPPGQLAVSDLPAALTMARSAKQQLSSLDDTLALSHALDQCWTVDEVVDTLSQHLDRLAVRRAFLALFERDHDTDGSDTAAVRVSPDRVRLVMDHRDGVTRDVPPASFLASEVLPHHLADELDHGMLVIQPLAVLDRPFGYMVFEQGAGGEGLAELLRIDLSRALDAVLTGQEMDARTSLLEKVVARRTRELQEEVMTRRRAERELEAANAELARSAMLDGLTEIANRTAFQAHLEEHLQAQVGSGQPLALLMIDVDSFKAYNDRYGHLVGDEALRTFAACLRRAVWGDDDLVCRYGGEEFAVVLPRSGRHAAVAVAQRFQGLLADAALIHEASPIAAVLTASIGIAVVVPEEGDDTDSLVGAADQALYGAKQAGRNRIHVAAWHRGATNGSYASTSGTRAIASAMRSAG